MEEMFGHYRLVRPLGSGGVGEVWQAVDTNLDRVVALKRLRPALQADPDAVARFRREARTAAKLRHLHIVRVHAIGVIGGKDYLDTEFIDGVDLARLLADTAGWLPVPRVLTIVDQVAAALDEAHGFDRPPEQRMVHRDVKPANVLVETRPGGSDHVYLADFGVARALVPDVRITRDGDVVGTPAYMPPELWEGHASDHRVDVYSLAIMLFEMLTGVLPFARLTQAAVINAHLTADVPAASGVRPDLPAAIDDVLRRGMAKKPGDRYGRAPELAEAARAALLTPPPPPPPPRPPPPPPPHSPPRPTYFGSLAHYVGMVSAVLVFPLLAVGVVHLDWTVFPVTGLLYALGAAGTVATRRPPPPQDPTIGK